MQGNNNLQDAGAALIDWSTPFDQNKVQCLTMVCQAMYSGNRQNMEFANNVMNQFKIH
jgi:hypothetical protein